MTLPQIIVLCGILFYFFLTVLVGYLKLRMNREGGEGGEGGEWGTMFFIVFASVVFTYMLTQISKAPNVRPTQRTEQKRVMAIPLAPPVVLFQVRLYSGKGDLIGEWLTDTYPQRADGFTSFIDTKSKKIAISGTIVVTTVPAPAKGE